MRRLRLSVIILLNLLPIGTTSFAVSGTKPIFDISRPAILAFFSAPTHASKDEADSNEALNDFQLYVRQARKSLETSGIDIYEVYARSFQVRTGTTTKTFQVHKAGVGYYFVAPGKEPRIEYGVLTDDDLLKISAAYFGLHSK